MYVIAIILFCCIGSITATANVTATTTTTSTTIKVAQCTKDSDCPVIRCLVAPCPLNVCKMGYCVPKIKKPRTNKPRTAKPRTLRPRTKRPHAPISIKPPVRSPIATNTTTIKCGTNTCGAGEYCCNESCGTCSKMGEGCTKKFCLPPGYCQADSDCPVPPCARPIDGITSYCPIPKCIKNQCTYQTPQPTKCGKVTCSADEYCCNESCGICINKMMGRPCNIDTCNPVVECRNDTDCATGKVCNTMKGQCITPPTIQCGNATCTNGNVCCNASCNICAPKGVFCIQKAC